MASPRSFILPGFVITAVVAGVSWSGYQQWVLPLEEKKTLLVQRTAKLQDQIGEARKTLRANQLLAMKASRVAGELAQLQEGSPGGSPLVWFPEVLKDHYLGFRVEEVATRVNTILEDPDLTGYERSYWATEISVESAPREIRKALLAMLDVEAAEPFADLLELTIGPNPDVPNRHVAVTNVALLAPKHSK